MGDIKPVPDDFDPFAETHEGEQRCLLALSRLEDRFAAYRERAEPLVAAAINLVSDLDAIDCTHAANLILAWVKSRREAGIDDDNPPAECRTLARAILAEPTAEAPHD